MALRIPGVDVHDVIQVHRRHLVELMQQWTRIKMDAGDHEVNLALVVDAELFRLDFGDPMVGRRRSAESGGRT